MSDRFVKEENRIYMNDSNGKLLAEVFFPKIDDDTVDLEHTFVDSSLRGQGIAGKIVKVACNTIREKGLRTKASCPYVKKWLKENPSESDIFID